MLQGLPTVDLVATGWYVLGMAFLIEWTAGAQNRHRAVWLVGCAVAVFGACFFRFAYYPLAFVPAGLLLAGAVLGNRHWWQPGLLVLVLTGGLVGAQILYQHFVARSVNYLSERHAASEAVIHWYNLKQFAPIVTRAIPGASQLPFSERVSDILLLLGLLAGSAAVARTVQHLNRPARQLLSLWLGVAWLSFWLNIAFMVFLSLKYPPESWGPWTYVQEVRYFSLNMSIVSGLLLFLIFWKGSPVPQFSRNLLYGVAVLVFIHAYVFGNFKHRVHEPTAYNEPLSTAAVVQQLVRNTPGQVVFASDHLHNYWGGAPASSMGMFGAMGGVAITHINSLIDSTPRSEPITVLAAVVETTPASLQTLYRERNARQVGIVGGIPLMQFTLPATTGRTDSRTAR
jgi:hypothetical protein